MRYYGRRYDKMVSHWLLYHTRVVVVSTNFCTLVVIHAEHFLIIHYYYPFGSIIIIIITIVVIAN